MGVSDFHTSSVPPPGDKLLVIGNGFDLEIGARTSYRSFFESPLFRPTREKAERWITLCNRNGRALPNANINDLDFNCWDLLFCMESEFSLDTGSKINWCDVEAVIHDSLINRDPGRFSWDNVRELLDNRIHHRTFRSGDVPDSKLLQLEKSHKNTKTMAEYLFQDKKWHSHSDNISSFYEMLLEELRIFEESFGLYIKRQSDRESYRNDAKRLAKRLLGSIDGIHVDSFNYSDFSDYTTQIRHINGNCDAPIFGINLSPEEERIYPELRHFTKTSRRIHQDAKNLNRETSWDPIHFNCAVVFGHSLNQMDYDYFYYLFTTLRMHTFDIDKMGSIHFIYKNYDPENLQKHRRRFTDAVYDVMNYFEDCVTSFNNHILINLMRFSGKLTINELDSIDEMRSRW